MRTLSSHGWHRRHASSLHETHARAYGKQPGNTCSGCARLAGRATYRPPSAMPCLPETSTGLNDEARHVR